MVGEVVEGRIICDIREQHEKTYPGVIFALTNNIEDQARQINNLENHVMALRATGRAVLQFISHKADCHSVEWWPEAECSCGMQEASDELRRAIGRMDGAEEV
jgi:hypothetical protein